MLNCDVIVSINHSPFIVAVAVEALMFFFITHVGIHFSSQVYSQIMLDEDIKSFALWLLSTPLQIDIIHILLSLCLHKVLLT